MIQPNQQGQSNQQRQSSQQHPSNPQPSSQPSMSLTHDKIREIETKAIDVLGLGYDHKEMHPPINLDILLEKSGITLKFGQFEDDKISGYYDKNTKTIYIAENEQFSRQVFTIAHELGHFFLHRNKVSDIFYRTDSIRLETQDGDEEQEANWFAASLLMPKPLIKMYWKMSGSIEEMSGLFQVSQSAVVWRLKNLELID